jgi:hypothetical protein
VAALRLSNSDRIRRDKLAGLLGSQFDGERLNALSMLQKMADSYKVRIDELLLDAGSGGTGSNFDRQRAEWAEREARRAHPDEAAPDAPKLPADWRDCFARAKELNQSRYFLTSWEANFAADPIARGTRWPSPKQAVVIVRIIEKARAFGIASADADWEDVL